MKRLVDESTDELTRSLLEAGRTHQPPAGNEAKLLLALGVGGSVGLFSSKAFAWLGSGAGKLTLVGVGVGVGVAGVAYTLASPPSTAVGTAASAETVLAGSMAGGARAGASPDVASSTALPEHVISERAALQPRAPEVEEGGTALPSGAASIGAASIDAASIDAASRAAAPTSPLLAADSLPEAPLDRARGSHRHAHGRRGRVTAPSHRTLAAEGSEATASLGNAAATSGATEQHGAAFQAVRSETGRSEAGRSEAGKTSEAADSQPAARATVPGLDSEVALVDAMRSALARGDGAALHRLIASYRGSFPHGQLQAEVAELAARPLPSAR